MSPRQSCRATSRRDTPSACIGGSTNRSAMFPPCSQPCSQTGARPRTPTHAGTAVSASAWESRTTANVCGRVTGATFDPRALGSNPSGLTPTPRQHALPLGVGLASPPPRPQPLVTPPWLTPRRLELGEIPTASRETALNPTSPAPPPPRALPPPPSACPFPVPLCSTLGAPPSRLRSCHYTAGMTDGGRTARRALPAPSACPGAASFSPAASPSRRGGPLWPPGSGRPLPRHRAAGRRSLPSPRIGRGDRG